MLRNDSKDGVNTDTSMYLKISTQPGSGFQYSFCIPSIPVKEGSMQVKSLIEPLSKQAAVPSCDHCSVHLFSVAYLEAGYPLRSEMFIVQFLVPLSHFFSFSFLSDGTI